MTKKQFLFTLAKIAFAAVVLTWLFHKVDAAKVWRNVRNAEIGPILAGIALCWITVLIAGLRWHRLLRAFEIRVPLSALISIAQIGQFFLMFLPGPAGDDLTRMLYISRIAKGRVAEACASVLLDRCIGLASILLLAVACLPWQWHLLASKEETYVPAVGIFAVGAVVLAAVILFFVINGLWMQRRVDKLLGFLPASGIRDQLLLVSKHIFTSKRAVAEVMAAAIGTQILLCSVFYFAGRSIGIDSPFIVWLGFVPIVLAANVVPITVAGIGVREKLSVSYLSVLAGVEGDRALAASFIVLGMTLVICLFGGIVYIIRRPARADEPRATT